MENRDNWWGPLTLLMMIALIGFGVAAMRTGKTLDGVSLIIGGLLTNFGTMLNFRYGSSKGSKEKTELLNKKEQQ